MDNKNGVKNLESLNVVQGSINDKNTEGSVCEEKTLKIAATQSSDKGKTEQTMSDLSMICLDGLEKDMIQECEKVNGKNEKGREVTDHNVKRHEQTNEESSAQLHSNSKVNNDNKACDNENEKKSEMKEDGDKKVDLVEKINVQTTVANHKDNVNDVENMEVCSDSSINLQKTSDNKTITLQQESLLHQVTKVDCELLVTNNSNKGTCNEQDSCKDKKEPSAFLGTKDDMTPLQKQNGQGTNVDKMEDLQNNNKKRTIEDVDDCIVQEELTPLLGPSLPGKSTEMAAEVIDDTMYVMKLVSEELKAVENTLDISKSVNKPPSSPSSSSSGTEDSDSDSDDEDSSDSSSSSDSESDNSIAELRKEIEKIEERHVSIGAPKIPGELSIEDLPEEPVIDIVLNEDVPLEEIGVIKSIVETLIVVEAKSGTPAINTDSLVFLGNRKLLGKVFEIFGPVQSPFYLIRFNKKEDIVEKEIKTSDEVFFAPKYECYTNYVFTAHLKKMKGSDASWKNDEEPPQECEEFSDDEQEAKAKSELKRQRQSKKQKAASETSTETSNDAEKTSGDRPARGRGRGRGQHGMRGRGNTNAGQQTRPMTCFPPLHTSPFRHPHSPSIPLQPPLTGHMQGSIPGPPPPPRPLFTRHEFVQPRPFPGQHLPFQADNPHMYYPPPPPLPAHPLYHPYGPPHPILPHGQFGMFAPPPPPPPPLPSHNAPYQPSAAHGSFGQLGLLGPPPPPPFPPPPM